MNNSNTLTMRPLTMKLNTRIRTTTFRRLIHCTTSHSILHDCALAVCRREPNKLSLYMSGVEVQYTPFKGAEPRENMLNRQMGGVCCYGHHVWSHCACVKRNHHVWVGPPEEQCVRHGDSSRAALSGAEAGAHHQEPPGTQVMAWDRSTHV